MATNYVKFLRGSVKAYQAKVDAGAISATRANVNDLVLTGYTGTERSGDRITDTDTIGKEFKSVEYNLDIIQGNDTIDGSIAKTVKDSATILSGEITAVSNRVSTIEDDYLASTSEIITTLQNEVASLTTQLAELKALVEQYHPTSNNPEEGTGS